MRNRRRVSEERIEGPTQPAAFCNSLANDAHNRSANGAERASRRPSQLATIREVPGRVGLGWETEPPGIYL